MKMKSSKTLAAGLLATAFAAVASATPTTYLHVIGSTAFRTAFVASVEDAMGGSYKAAAVGSGLAAGGEQSANISIISGNIGGVPVIVKCFWTGSVTGIQTLAAGTSLSSAWLKDSVLPSTASTIPVSVSTATGNCDAASPADLSMSDSHPSSTALAVGNLTAQPVGVIVFEWVANNGFPSSVTNITPLQIQSLLSGTCQLSQFTGNDSDSGTPVYMVGRSGDSGTRLSYLTESGAGLFASIKQVQPTVVGGVVTALDLSGTVYSATASSSTLNFQFQDQNGNNLGFPNIAVSDPFLGSVAPGQSGFASGGAVSGPLAASGSNTAMGGSLAPGFLISYLGRSDAKNACAGGNTGHRLTWNGFGDFGGLPAGTATTSSAFANLTAGLGQANGQGTDNATLDNAPVQNGQYSGWEIEFLVNKTSLADGADGVLNVAGSTELTIANTIAADIQSDAAADAKSGLQLSSMKVSRNVEGGVITYGAPSTSPTD